MEAWWFTVGAHAVLTIGYAWIASILFWGNTSARQWRANPIATATFTIFLSCGIGHGLHVFHAFESQLGLASSSTTASQIAMGDPLLLVWSGATALVAVWYLTMRGRLGIVTFGAPLCEDMEAREQRAQKMRIPIQDAIIRAETRLALGDREGAMAALDEAMAISRDVVTELIGDDPRMRIKAGDLRRRSTV